MKWRAVGNMGPAIGYPRPTIHATRKMPNRKKEDNDTVGIEERWNGVPARFLRELDKYD